MEDPAAVVYDGSMKTYTAIPLDSPAHAATPILHRLAQNESVPPHDVAAMATALAPIDLRMPNEPSVLRRAIQRENNPFSLAHLEELARANAAGPAAAWADAQIGSRKGAEGSLAVWLARELAWRSEPVARELCLKIIELSSPEHLRMAESEKPLGSQLLAASRNAGFGLDPAVAWAKALGKNIFTMTMQGARDLAILEARSSDAFARFLAEGHDPRQVATNDARPLWGRWRDRLTGSTAPELLAHICEWALINEKDAEEQRILREYFYKLSNAHSGIDHLRKRSDWATLVGEDGQTPMMALAAANPAFIASFRDVKKAENGLRALDHSGRSISHYYLSSGKSRDNSPKGTGSFLASHAPPSLDAKGRGMIPSTLAMLDNKCFGFRFSEAAIDAMCKKSSSAIDWFNCARDEDVAIFSHWLLEEQVVHPKKYDSGYIASLAKLILNMDPMSFSALDPRVSGALAVTLAMVPDEAAGQNRDACLAAILSCGATAEMSPQRRELLVLRADPKHLAMIDSVCLIAAERVELQSSVPELGASPSGPAKSTMRI